MQVLTQTKTATISTKRITPKSGELVSTQHAESLISNYKKSRWAQNSDRLGQKDSTSVWYSVEELEGFLAMVKQAGGDGIKMNFGVYADNYEAVPENAGKQTVVLVATKTREKENGGIAVKNLYINTNKGTSLLAFNKGKLPAIGDDNIFEEGISIQIDDKGQNGIFIS